MEKYRGIRSILGSWSLIVCNLHFHRRLQSGLNLMAIPARFGLNVPSDLRGGLRSCCQFSELIRTLFSGSVLVASSLSLGYLLKGAQKFLEGLLRDCMLFPEKSSP